VWSIAGGGAGVVTRGADGNVGRSMVVVEGDVRENGKGGRMSGEEDGGRPSSDKSNDPP
jgi:hypothetical protein